MATNLRVERIAAIDGVRGSEVDRLVLSICQNYDGSSAFVSIIIIITVISVIIIIIITVILVIITIIIIQVMLIPTRAQ